MCGIAALQIRNPELRGSLGQLMHGMLCEIVDRGPDSAGVALYDSDGLTPQGTNTVTVLGAGVHAAAALERIAALLPEGADATATDYAESMIVNAHVDTPALEAAVRHAFPDAQIIGRGSHVAVLKGVGHPVDLAAAYGLAERGGVQGISHTRMATESAVTAAGAHPFTVSNSTP